MSLMNFLKVKRTARLAEVHLKGPAAPPPLPPNAVGVSPPGETYSKGVKTGMLFYWEKQRQEIKSNIEGI